jgi:hypothetical protein
VVLTLMLLCPSFLKHITAFNLTNAVSNNTYLKISCDYLFGGMCYCNFYILSTIITTISSFTGTLFNYIMRRPPTSTLYNTVTNTAFLKPFISVDCT